MSTYLLDTNHLSPMVTLSHSLRRRVLAQIELGDQFVTCVPVVTETVFGFRLLPRAIQNMQEWGRLKFIFLCRVPDLQDAEQAAELQVTLRKQGWQLETVDALIAAVTIRHDLILLTTDRDFRAVPQLRTENWLV